MFYGKVENQKVVELMTKPKWFFDDGTIVDDLYLQTEHIYPIPESAADYQDDYDFLRYNRIVNEKDDLIFDSQLKNIKNYFKYEEKTLDEVYAFVQQDVINVRNSFVYSDIEYNFPSGMGFIQLRNEEDVRNIQVNGMEALKDVVEGNPTKTHYFMDESNTLREMTAQQMVDMTSFVKSVGQHHYSVSWTHKHVNLKAIYENDSLTDEQKIDELLAYDYRTGWVIETPV